jgi:hypothetical protein
MVGEGYTQEFKIAAVQQITQEGHSIPDVARRLGFPLKAFRTAPTSQTFAQIKLSVAAAYNMADAIDISDILLTVKDIIGVSSLTGKAKQAAEFDISDVLLMVKHVINIAHIDHFDLIDGSGDRVSQLTDLISGDAPNFQLIMNGDINLDGAFNDTYTMAFDVI